MNTNLIDYVDNKINSTLKESFSLNTEDFLSVLYERYWADIVASAQSRMIGNNLVIELNLKDSTVKELKEMSREKEVLSGKGEAEENSKMNNNVVLPHPDLQYFYDLLGVDFDESGKNEDMIREEAQKMYNRMFFVVKRGKIMPKKYVTEFHQKISPGFTVVIKPEY